MLRQLLDPMTNKIFEFNLNNQEDFLWKVLEAACGEDCPPEGVEYLCDISEVPVEKEEEVCAQCYLNWAAKAGKPNTPCAVHLLQAIGMACDNKCPPDKKDYVCRAGEDEDTSIETCTTCIMRWAIMPFWKERNHG